MNSKKMNATRFTAVFFRTFFISTAFLFCLCAWALQCEICNLEIPENSNRIRNGTHHYHQECYTRNQAEGAGGVRRMQEEVQAGAVDQTPLEERNAIDLLDLARSMPLNLLQTWPIKELSCEDIMCCAGAACGAYFSDSYFPLGIPLIQFFDKQDYNTAAENANAVVALVGAASDRLHQANDSSLRDYLRVYLGVVGDGKTGWFYPQPTYQITWSSLEIDILAARIILAYSGSRLGTTHRSVWGNHYYYTPIQIIQELAKTNSLGQYLIKNSTLRAEADLWKDTPGVQILPRY